MIKLIAVEPNYGCQLLLRFSDGASDVFDFSGAVEAGTEMTASEKLRFEHVFGRLLNIVESWHFQILETASTGRYRDDQLRNIANFVRTRCDFPGVLEF